MHTVHSERPQQGLQAHSFVVLLFLCCLCHNQKQASKLVKTTAIAVRAAPDVGAMASVGSAPRMVANQSKSINYNPTYEALWAPEQGPKNPFYADGITPGL